jgi:isopenicillin N synthase-like dioxygenase
MIPTIDIAALYGPPSPARDQVDRAVLAAASGIGFMTVENFPGAELLAPAARAELLRIFTLSDADKAKLFRWNFDPARKNVYRGWFPLQTSVPSWKEGVDFGPDIAHGEARVDPSDPLTEASPFPPEEALPGWRAAAARYYVAMEAVGAGLMRSVARGLGLPEKIFDEAFAGGISSLRFARYPLRPAREDGGPDFSVDYRGEKRGLIGGAHVDSGFVTLLAQDGVEGLQARNLDGEWIDVPPADGTLAVNFGKLLDRWTAGKVRATLHRVIAPGRERFSIPFFYEPRVDAEIAPLPLEGATRFEPFLYGDYLWDTTTSFIEQKGIRHLRQPRRALAS